MVTIAGFLDGTPLKLDPCRRRSDVLEMDDHGGESQRLGVEQRVFYRIPISLPVRYRFEVPGQAAVSGDGSTVNLSAGGLLLRCRPPQEPILMGLIAGRGQVEIGIELPGSGPLQATGQPMWAERPGGGECLIGLRFLDLDEEKQGRLRAFVLASFGIE